MRHGWLLRPAVLSVLALMVGALMLPAAAVQAAPAYHKFTLSGPGLKPSTVEVRLADNAMLLKAMALGLESAQPGTPLMRSGITYRLDWWQSTCGLPSALCSPDPARAAPIHTLYLFDLASRRGYLRYIDPPTALAASVGKRWLEMPPEFDQVLQGLIAEHTDPGFLSLWITCRTTVEQDLQAGNAP
jgi:hypothetical protein